MPSFFSSCCGSSDDVEDRTPAPAPVAAKPAKLEPTSCDDDGTGQGYQLPPEMLVKVTSGWTPGSGTKNVEKDGQGAGLGSELKGLNSARSKSYDEGVSPTDRE